MFTDSGFAEVAVALIIAAAAGSWALWNRYRNRKDIRFVLISNTSLVSIRREAQERIQVLFDGNKIEDARLAVVRIFNQGRVPVNPNDFTEPLTIDAGPNSTLVTADVTDLVPPNLRVSAYVDDNKVKIDPVLLNEGDSFTVNVIGSNISDGVNLDSLVRRPFRAAAAA